MPQYVSTPLSSGTSPLCSLTLRGTSQETPPFHWEGMSLGKVKSRSFKDPDPAPSLVPLDRAISNVIPSQTRMSAALDSSKEGETCSVHMPLQITGGPLTETRKLGELRQDLYFQCSGLKGK